MMIMYFTKMNGFSLADLQNWKGVVVVRVEIEPSNGYQPICGVVPIQASLCDEGVVPLHVPILIHPHRVTHRAEVAPTHQLGHHQAAIVWIPALPGVHHKLI
jgi:hypothetical protein